MTDIAGGVREVVAGVGVDLPAHPHPVQEPAPVGVDQASNELPRLLVDEFCLPVGEPDRTQVLRASAVLREQANELVRVDDHDSTPAPGVRLIRQDPVVWEYRLHRAHTLAGYAGPR